ncbi:hypothetical protein GCM10025868_24570 [Angustibacter aerolatus]|uniref:Glycosyltransferase 2-like domain-containing protein n=1 Tax=Angustibacter aerolatus TaxID=1162965 RepID=A0ABQ6JG69_9ACTN|nr:hypothetical protein GCM10025868_24570 [Angustibacter aerolatus]
MVPTGAPTPDLAAGLDSVLQQTLRDLEVLVVHPAARGAEVAEVVDRLGDDRVRLLATDGPDRSAALAAGAAAATGAWVAFCPRPATGCRSTSRASWASPPPRAPRRRTTSSNG